MQAGHTSQAEQAKQVKIREKLPSIFYSSPQRRVPIKGCSSAATLLVVPIDLKMSRDDDGETNCARSQ